MLTIKVSRAKDDQTLCNQFAAGHEEALASKLDNPLKISTNNKKWFKNPCVYLITAHINSTGQLAAGVRIHLKNNIPLPLEEAIGEMDPAIYKLVSACELPGETGEICALWNNKKGMKVTEKLMIAALAFCEKLPLKQLFCFSGQHMYEFVSSFGFQVETSLRNNGTFHYPNDQYQSRIVSINPQTLEKTNSAIKQEILHLRQNQVLSKVYDMEGQAIQYDFMIDYQSPDQSPSLMNQSQEGSTFKS